MSERPDYRKAHENAAPMAAGPTGPLAGIRIVDFTRALAGPFCTMLLADLGADVIKIEPPEGDFSRYSEPYPEGDTERAFGGYFASINRNKRGVMVDLKDSATHEKILALIDGADAVVENFRVGIMEKLGFGYETLHLRNPRLVYAAIRGFGDPRTGASPYAEWPSYDVVAQAMGGIVSMTGTEEGQVLKVGASVGDLYPGTVAALGIVSALLHAKLTGEGQFLDVGMVDAVTALCEAAVYRYTYAGTVTKPLGNSHPQLTPFDVYQTADGYCAIAAPTQNHWALLCAHIDRPDLIHDPRTISNKDRVANAAFVKEVVSGWTRARATHEVIELLGGAVPVGPVNDAEALFTDPHLHARQMLVAVDHPGSDRPVVLPNSPIHFTATPSGIYRRPPKLGEHNAEVFAEIDRQENP
ncbi:CoA transferase [Candidatus Amarobacter glycogenicus]|uniref:CaiB/BaiF CoA transferase family protein n=1 Tax=Candidatus Amarobacter glycogenicus TaxID=3140699 RepID=UPI0031CC3A6D